MRKVDLLVLSVGLIIVLTASPSSCKTDCYLCSWERDEERNETDYCTWGNFQENRVKAFPCPYGCEIGAVYDKNGELEHFFRNCAVKDTLITNSCELKDYEVITKKICTCDSNLCNIGGISAAASTSTIVLLVFVTAAWWTFDMII